MARKPRLSTADVRQSETNDANCDEAKRSLELILSIVEIFCLTHLNDEYAGVCKKLAQKLSTLRPSPLAKGKPELWASGIIYTIGMANFLGDPSQSPHMKMAAISKLLHVGESSTVAKSSVIRRTLEMSQLDAEWTLPSRMDQNPLLWMLLVNGFPVDIRHMPREVQEEAFEQGLIPYIPADR